MHKCFVYLTEICVLNTVLVWIFKNENKTFINNKLLLISFITLILILFRVTIATISCLHELVFSLLRIVNNLL